MWRWKTNMASPLILCLLCLCFILFILSSISTDSNKFDVVFEKAKNDTSLIQSELRQYIPELDKSNISTIIEITRNEYLKTKIKSVVIESVSNIAFAEFGIPKPVARCVSGYLIDVYILNQTFNPTVCMNLKDLI